MLMKYDQNHGNMIVLYKIQDVFVHRSIKWHDRDVIHCDIIGHFAGFAVVCTSTFVWVIHY